MPRSFHHYAPRDGHGLKHDPFNAIIAPRPIGWISTQRDGIRNLAPYSFFNGFNYTPPIIGFASVGRKDTLRNIESTGEFVWNLATWPLAQEMNATSAPVAADIDEFQLAKLETIDSTLVKPPRVAQSPASFECRATQIVRLRTSAGEDMDTWLILGEVVMAHIDKATIENGVYVTARAEPIMRGGGAGDYFRISEELRFSMPRPR